MDLKLGWVFLSHMIRPQKEATCLLLNKLLHFSFSDLWKLHYFKGLQLWMLFLILNKILKTKTISWSYWTTGALLNSSKSIISFVLTYNFKIGPEVLGAVSDFQLLKNKISFHSRKRPLILICVLLQDILLYLH